MLLNDLDEGEAEQSYIPGLSLLIPSLPIPTSLIQICFSRKKSSEETAVQKKIFSKIKCRAIIC